MSAPIRTYHVWRADQEPSDIPSVVDANYVEANGSIVQFYRVDDDDMELIAAFTSPREVGRVDREESEPPEPSSEEPSSAMLLAAMVVRSGLEDAKHPKLREFIEAVDQETRHLDLEQYKLWHQFDAPHIEVVE